MPIELQTDKIAPPVSIHNQTTRQADATIIALVQYVKALQADVAKLRDIVDSL